jgi:putative FmdB family regulatory protein
MPLYEYQCSKCEKKFEVIQKFADEPLTEHEGCGGSVQRLMSAPSFHLKGSGWYATDYAKTGKAGSESSAEGKLVGAKTKGSDSSESKSTESKAAEAASEAKGESKSEAKTESKAESKPAAPATKSE